MPKSKPLAVVLAGWLLVAAATASHAQAVADPDAPTATTLTPEQIDAIWRQSVSKFDGERAKVLKRVRAVTSGPDAGPFLPDWRSLQAYRTPAWYADAKFGIFVHW